MNTAAAAGHYGLSPDRGGHPRLADSLLAAATTAGRRQAHLFFPVPSGKKAVLLSAHSLFCCKDFVGREGPQGFPPCRSFHPQDVGWKPPIRRVGQHGGEERLRQGLARTGWISEGYVQDRGSGAGGPCYQWTRKIKGKTVSVVLSREQYEWLKEAIGNWRQLQKTMREMQQLSRQVLFATDSARTY
jgi:hypothetical protein